MVSQVWVLAHEIVLRVELCVRSLMRRRLHQLLRWLMEVSGLMHRRPIHDPTLIQRNNRLLTFLLNRARWTDPALWQLNYGSYGTFDFYLVVDLVVGLAVVVVW